jgi:hypothetical protein
MLIDQNLHFSWKKIALLALINITFSFLLIYLYKTYQSPLYLYLLGVISLSSTVVYLLMVKSIAPTQKLLRILTLFTALTPFLALPLVAFLWYLKKDVVNPYFNKYKIILLLAGSLAALTISIQPTEFLSRKELLVARVLPNEISLVILSLIESERISAISPLDVVSSPYAVAKILKIRKEKYPNISSSMGINPNGIFKILPLGLGWIRGAPAHIFALLHYHYLQR